MDEKGTLPTGDEIETFVFGPPPEETWGFSYALCPYLSAIIGAVFVKAAKFLFSSERILLLAARMGSVLAIPGSCWFLLKLGCRLFARRSSCILFAVLICFLPQVQFLGMYHNNDALSLFAVCMMCIVFCIVSVLINPEISNKGGLILKRGGLIAGICLVPPDGSLSVVPFFIKEFF